MISRAPGKMILLGEYAVLEGAPALVCAVDHWAEVKLEKRDINEYLIHSPSMGIEAEPFVVTPKGHLRFNPLLEENIKKRLAFFTSVFEYVWTRLNAIEKTLPVLSITLNTDEFYSREWQTKLGLGSSAAMTVALVYGLFKYMDRNFGLSEIYTAAYRAHHEAQGNIGSGIDIAASTFGGRLIYQMPKTNTDEPEIPQRVAACDALKVLTVWSGKAASTRHFIQGVNRLKEEMPHIYVRLIDQLTDLSVQGCSAYKDQNMEQFLETIRRFYITMKDLGHESGLPIISETHETIAEEAARHGLAYKPSGAGGGDIGLAFGDDQEKISAFSSKIREMGFNILNIHVVNDGVQIVDS